MLDVRYGANMLDAKQYDTQRLRKEFLIEELFNPDSMTTVYSHIDRIIVAGTMPVLKEISIEDYVDCKKELGCGHFLERRELGVINIGGPGKVFADEVNYHMQKKDALYIGMGCMGIRFSSDDEKNPAKFYICSTPAHIKYPNCHVDITKAKKVPMGSIEESNKRVINQLLHPDVMRTCQLMMGLTELEPGSVWNTMPSHTHDRRMEVYMYFEVDGGAVFHFMGEPTETRHIVMRNEQAVISPSWSIHAGAGTKNYCFIWAMAGENQTFGDMDSVLLTDIR